MPMNSHGTVTDSDKPRGAELFFIINFLCVFSLAMSHGTSAKLDIHRVSPVRGQLEAYDPHTPKGCRYIQCTETPNELKV